MTAPKEKGGFNFFLPGVFYAAMAQKRHLVGEDKHSIWKQLKADEVTLHCEVRDNFANLAILEAKKQNNKEFEHLVDAFRKKKPP